MNLFFFLLCSSSFFCFCFTSSTTNVPRCDLYVACGACVVCCLYVCLSVYVSVYVYVYVYVYVFSCSPCVLSVCICSFFVVVILIFLVYFLPSSIVSVGFCCSLLCRFSLGFVCFVFSFAPVVAPSVLSTLVVPCIDSQLPPLSYTHTPPLVLSRFSFLYVLSLSHPPLCFLASHSSMYSLSLCASFGIYHHPPIHIHTHTHTHTHIYVCPYNTPTTRTTVNLCSR
jgi:hypothetical protein